jgi:alanyl-tRNA synthetase
MEAGLVRKKFLEFFASKSHQIVPSAPLVNKNDPTLMFTNAGMNQFKDLFLGHSAPKYPRVADTQKCLRVSGKHNDLEEVGIDTYHHTMFEMLGNWSFGDYFKKEAIEWAWELLTEVYQLPKDRLYVTVFGGDKEEGLSVDDEAYNLWKKIVSEDRIIYGNKKDNFWEMGEAGPCGPCSEIHIDMRSDADIKLKPGRDLVNNDHPQVIEIWNLVFMEFNRLSSGKLEPLPAKHVDTGMGFERLCMAIQGKSATYDSDVFTPLISFIAHAAHTTYGQNEKTDIAIRVIADHVRAVAFTIADGQLPSNTGAGYVIRRILRRAVRYGFTFLNFKEPFIYKLVTILSEQMGDVFPEIRQQQDYITRVIQEEEISFLRTLEKGLKRMEVIKEDLHRQSEKLISGEQSFELYDTFGFPLDLTSLIARENGLSVDEKGFAVEMAKQKSRSKADAVKATGDWIEVSDEDHMSFIGYDLMESRSRLLKYRKLTQKGKDFYQLVLDQTPFYAESGGQVGDTGYLQFENEKISVIDTLRENELIVHITDKLPVNPEAECHAVINSGKRLLTMNNHSATHLLHAALREVLGQHVEQKGSLVNEKLLRFDFSHFTGMTDEEISQVESIVNKKIRENIQLQEMRNIPIEEAKSMGAMALFGEKYGEFVRVIIFDKNYSVELCGGTHVKATGAIGYFKIISESSVAAGVRRIEALTASVAIEYVNDRLTLFDELKTVLRNPKDVLQSTKTLVEEKLLLEKKLEALYQTQASDLRARLAADVSAINGMQVVIAKVNLPDADKLKQIAYELRNQFNDLFMVLAADIEGKPQIAVMLGESVVAKNKFHAGNMIKELAKEIQGGGGGQPFFATAGGKDLSGLDRVLKRAKEMVF